MSSDTRLPAAGGHRRLVLDCAAKINLTLEILRRRDDGYHEIRTVMQSIDLHDRLTIEVTAGDSLGVETSDPGLPTGDQNLAGQAARLLLDAAGVTAAVRIAIDKRIPAGAGLGGGSSDAAGTLWGLNRLLGRPFGAGVLLEMAGLVGSDVPFFLVGGTCLCTGRGERVRRLPPLPACGILLAIPPVSVETQWAYRHRARIGLTPDQGYTRMAASAIRQRSTSLVANYLWNDFEDIVLGRHEVVQDARNLLLGVGAIGAQLSGSGSAVFGLILDPREARRVARSLCDANHPVHGLRPTRTALVPLT